MKFLKITHEPSKDELFFKDIEDLAEQELIEEGYEVNKKNNKEENLDIKKAVKHPGAFREWCQEHGFDKVTQECIELGLQDPDPVVRKRAAFAKTLLKLQKKAKKKNSNKKKK
jgi:hypothetical protein